MKPVLTDGTEKRWGVKVNDMEINNFLMTFINAEKLAFDYKYDKFKDIVVFSYDTGEEVRIV